MACAVDDRDQGEGVGKSVHRLQVGLNMIATLESLHRR
jgi:hypothetical protein